MPGTWEPSDGLPPETRTNTTSQTTNHANDHNLTHGAIAWLLDPPRFRVTKNATQSVGNSSLVQVTYPVEEYDVGGCFASNQFTVPAGCGGLWLLTASLAWPSNATGLRYLHFRVGASDTRYGESVLTPISGSYTVQQIIVEMELAAAQYVRVYAFQTSGGSLTIPADASAGGRTTFTGRWVAEAA